MRIRENSGKPTQNQISEPQLQAQTNSDAEGLLNKLEEEEERLKKELELLQNEESLDSHSVPSSKERNKKIQKDS